MTASSSTPSPADPQPASPAGRKARRVLTREDWIDTATDLLASKSVDAVKIEVLATTLHITIGSFYYHFKDRNDLLLGVLQRWHERTTAHVVQSAANLTIDQAVQRLLSLPLHGSTARRAAMIEFAIRSWARADTVAHDVVSEVDRQRLAYYARAFQKAGYGKADAANKAFLVYSFQLSQALLWDAQDEKSRKKQLRHFKSLILGA
jgi:AcrR family transcriptional regulator